MENKFNYYVRTYKLRAHVKYYVRT